MDQQGNAFSLFQTAINLENRVRSRTEELRSTLRRLEQSNIDLGAAKENAELANLSKTRFLAAASHDVLQPLNAAHLSVSALAEIQTTDEGRTLVRQVERSLETMEDLLHTLLDISKLDAGVVKPEIVDVALEPLLASILSDFQPLARAKGLRLKIRAARRRGALRPHAAAPHPAEHPLQRAALHALAAACWSASGSAAPPSASTSSTPAAASPTTSARPCSRNSTAALSHRHRAVRRRPRARPVHRAPHGRRARPPDRLHVACRPRHGLPARHAGRRRRPRRHRRLRPPMPERPRGYGLFGTRSCSSRTTRRCCEAMIALLERWQCVVRAAALDRRGA